MSLLLRRTGSSAFAQAVNATCTTSVLVLKRVNKNVVVTCSTLVSILKRVNKTIAVTCTSSTVVNRLFSKFLSISATCTTTASVTKQVLKRVSTSLLTQVLLLLSRGHVSGPIKPTGKPFFSSMLREASTRRSFSAPIFTKWRS